MKWFSKVSPYENVYGLHLEVSLPGIGFPLVPLELLVLLVEPRLKLEQLRCHVNAPFLVVFVFRVINFQLYGTFRHPVNDEVTRRSPRFGPKDVRSCQGHKQTTSAPVFEKM